MRPRYATIVNTQITSDFARVPHRNDHMVKSWPPTLAKTNYHRYQCTNKVVQQQFIRQCKYSKQDTSTHTTACLSYFRTVTRLQLQSSLPSPTFCLCNPRCHDEKAKTLRLSQGFDLKDRIRDLLGRVECTAQWNQVYCRVNLRREGSGRLQCTCRELRFHR